MKMRGFTLIEAVLSLSLLAFGLLGLLYIFENASVNTLIADQAYVAENLARQALETVIAQRDSALAGGGYTTTLAAIQANSYNQTPVSGFTGYNLTVTGVEVDAQTSQSTTNFTVALPGSGYALVTATVTWNSGRNSVQLATLISNYT